MGFRLELVNERDGDHECIQKCVYVNQSNEFGGSDKKGRSGQVIIARSNPFVAE